ncbi:hydrogenase maturation protease [Aliiroseovarius subalbicans]|uniref:hydrogenase maturation protease n=1 Tax=Aliiroseovarius subalbicans TaxID=2925840 RepID=UPI001F58E17D|nr:hydrogenase maturation protease [Aliiroseovarius subalbicans]MCI2397803.1 hydrogenase maturation protease [Aliiroseovarius subalbicans]
MTAADHPLVIGVGNIYAGDDAAGRHVAQGLRDAGFPGEVVESAGVAADLVPLFETRDHVILVDACRSGASPGTIHRFDALDAPLPPFLSPLSSHGYGVGEAVELARALDMLPARCEVFAIEGACFDMGTQMAPAVAEAVEHCIAELMTP